MAKSQSQLMIEGGTIGEWVDASVIGDGWKNILRTLDTVLDKLGTSYEVYRVKEKFGRLRIYYACDDAIGAELINWAMTAANTRCEECGGYGRLRNTKKDGSFAWLRTLCYDHADEMGYEVPPSMIVDLDDPAR